MSTVNRPRGRVSERASVCVFVCGGWREVEVVEEEESVGEEEGVREGEGAGRN